MHELPAAQHFESRFALVKLRARSYPPRVAFFDDLNRPKAPRIADESRFDAKIEDQDEIPPSSPDHEYRREIEVQVR